MSEKLSMARIGGDSTLLLIFMKELIYNTIL
jgi:hypothetical protein